MYFCIFKHSLKVVESHLMDDNRLTEVLNIEISQGIVKSVDDAVNWVKGTFLYRRVQSHPLFYGFNGNGDDALHSFVLGKCADSIDKLRKIRAIEMNEDATSFSPTPGSHVMSRNFIDFETMKDIIKLPQNSGPLQLLHMISNCSKIQTPVRRHEKKALNEAYKRIKYKLEGCVSNARVFDAIYCGILMSCFVFDFHLPAQTPK
jgi:replicative superfamily II helicase